MAKLKSTAKTRSAPKATEAAPRNIMDSAQQIWQAGMGAFSRAQEEGGKLFETLVKEGSTLEQKTRKLATGKVDAVRDAVENRVGAVKERAADTWDRLEKVFEDRVQRALTRLGVPGRDDLQSLIARVDTLNAELRKLGGAKAAPSRKAGAKPAATTRKTVKKAVAKRKKAIKDLTD
ncbi:MAG: phasin family protein [Chiayiivirga sp.]|jgi:poly(hydroxyalkanoate) granule-associated protein|uniref:phasin family protein n=1 Tax=Chiayiivirga sp. TaxID=2041042 RepID=UPI0025BA0CEE|nr:phasin family protein [Chiayiivirga sp.]MCI1709798.1 phasin family protein [Chiayiivirga sp.]MCI1729895.1 phasin family protein [Chiayiivirga sp.]